METFIEGFRLSRQQRRVWLRQQHDQSSVYRVLCAVRIEGRLDKLLFREAIMSVFESHEIQRTRFECLPEMSLPLQVIEPDVALQIDEYHFSHPQDQEVEIEKLFRQLSRETGIGRVVLVEQSAGKHVLIISLPALNADAKSLENLVGEIQAAYETGLLGEEWTSEACQFTQFSEWQNELEETDQGAWEQEIAACDAALSLPFEQAAKSGDFEPEIFAIEIAPGSFESSFLLACWQVLLWRVSGQSEIVVGNVCEDRSFEELQTALGPFAETLPISASLHANVQFSELRMQTAEAIAKASEWKDYFAWPERSGEPRFIPFSFEFRKAAITQSNPSLTFSIFKYYACTDRFKIKLSILGRADSLTAEFHYDSNLFRAQDIQRLALRFQTLIASASNNTGVTLAQLDMLSTSEREQILREFNDTARQYPTGKLVFQLFEQQAEQNPNNIAVVFEDRQLTYRELNERTNQLAHYLRSRGVGPEVRVGLCFERSLEMIVGVLGVMKAGGAYVPFEPSLPKERLEALLEDAQCSILLTHESLDGEAISQQSKANLSSTVSGANAAYVIFTSGSTGKPKGVVIEHRQLLAYVQAIVDRLELPAGSSFAMVSTFAADLGHTATFPSLATGGCLHVIGQSRVTDARLLSEYFTRHQIDCLKIVPSHLSTLLESFPEGELLPRKRLILGGEAAHWKLIDTIRERAPECQIYNHYGPTETTVGAVSGRVDANQSETSVALGCPIANARVFIVKEELQLALIGEAGELCIGGQGVGRGYFNAADVTAEKFIPDPFSVEAGGRIYRTGDRARYLENGDIEFLGRIDRQVKIRGFRVEPGEIESILVQHPRIREAAVVALDSEAGGKRLVAYVVGEHGDLQEFFSTKLPDYMAPSAIVWLKELPLTTNGKIDYASLPAPDVEQDEEQFVAPRTAFEEMLCGIWTEVLHVERVSVVGDFFELGGHSLLVMLLVSRIRDVFGVEIPLGSVFDHPTVATLAEVIETALEGDAKPALPLLKRVSRDQALPLSFAQQRLWFINQMEPDSTVYNIPLAKLLVGNLNIEVLERALSELLRRHESLRTTFPIIDGEARQVIAEAQPLRLAITDLSDRPDVETAAQQLVNEEAQQPFDLAQGPLFRARLLRLSQQQHVLLFTLHHIVSDGWSMDLLFRELSLLHNAYARGEESPLAEPEVQYADYAVWQREWLSGAVLESQLAYWKQQLHDTEVLELSTDRPRPAVQSFKGSTESFRLPESLSRQLKELSQREGVTLFMTLLAVFQVLLSRYSGQQDVLVGTPILGRNRKEMESVVGFFVNTLTIRANFSGAPRFREILAQVKQTCLAAYAHQDIPFDRLVEELRPARSLSHQPLFQVLFQLQNGRRDRLSIEGLSVKSMKPQGETTKCDLMLALLDNDQELLGSIQYSTDLFDPETIQRMIGHFQNLLESAITDPAQPVAQLSLLAETERQQLLAEWNDTMTDYPRDKCIHEIFEAQVAETPEAIALVYKEERLTYRELNERANRLAYHLSQAGVGAETVVAIMLERSPEMVVALLATLKAGAAYLPLDAGYPPARLRLMLEDAGAQVLVTHGQLPLDLHANLKIVDLDAQQEQSSEPVTSKVFPDSLAYVTYTSGSTGLPKGTCVSHRNVLRLVCNSTYAKLNNECTLLQLAPVSFDAATFEIWGALLKGGRLVLYAGSTLDLREIGWTITENQVTTLWLTAGLFQQMVEEQTASLRGVRELLAGGDVLPVESVRRVLEERIVARLINGYGPTECTTFTCTYAMSDVQEMGNGSIPIGRPISDTQVYVLDSLMQPVPVGVTGELYVGGDGLARGYLGNASLTAERFVPNPLSSRPGERLYRTGDLTRYLPGGNIEFLGRRDLQVKVRGFRVELGEIETALCSHEQVREAVVLAHEQAGGEKRLVAYVVGQDLSSSQLRSHLKERLPEYMVPPAFVVMETLPLTPNGKVDRDALIEPEHLASEQEYVAPRSEVERLLCDAWAEVLKVERVGIHDNFFDLGGYSLLATKLITRVRELFTIEMPLQSVFDLKTVAELAELVEKARGNGHTIKSAPIRRLAREAVRREALV